MAEWSVYCRPGQLRTERGAWKRSEKSSGADRELSAILSEVPKPGRFEFSQDRSHAVPIPYGAVQCFSEEYENVILEAAVRAHSMEELRRVLLSKGFLVVDGKPRTPHFVRL